MAEDKICLIIFGITSDLALKKLIPSLVNLHKAGLLPQDLKLVGIGRRDFSEDEFHLISQISREFIYLQNDINSDELYQQLEITTRDCPNRLIYLSTFPHLYESIVDSLDKYHLTQSEGWTRLMVEKPVGHNLTTAQNLLDHISQIFSDDQLFLVDHYLGKEVLQNLLIFRFANNLFENIINSDNIDHIQILASETVGIENRGRFYDKTGALKDVGQNHLLQMLAFTTMDQPEEFSSQAIHRSRLKLLQELEVDPQSLVLGQYEGYKQEGDVDPNSTTETFFSFKTMIHNTKFQGVPIYLTAGKKLHRSLAEISIVFKQHSDQIFSHQYQYPNILSYRIQPDESISLKVINKTPGHNIDLENTFLRFCYKDVTDSIPEAYEKLLIDALEGDQTFFPKPAEIKAQWVLVDQLEFNKPEVQIYTPGSWGPPIPHFLHPSEFIC